MKDKEKKRGWRKGEREGEEDEEVNQCNKVKNLEIKHIVA